MGQQQSSINNLSLVKIYEKNNFNSQVYSVGLGNYVLMPHINYISSIEVPKGLTVYLYEKPYYTGAMWVIKGPYRCGELYSHQHIWTNKPKSMRIMMTPYEVIEGMIGSQVNEYGLLNDGLQCYLDSRQTASYNGQGTLWKDLSGNNRHFEWGRPPQYSDGRFKFIQGIQAKGPPSNSFNLGTGQNGYAIVVISRQLTLSRNRVFHFLPQSGSFGISVHQTWDNPVTYFDNMTINPVGQNRITTDIGQRWNQTCVWVYVRTATGLLKIYCNSQLLKIGSQPAIPLNLSNQPAIINDSWNADITMFAVYNKELSNENVKTITDWWSTSEAIRINGREGNMANKIVANIPNFPIPYGLQCYLDVGFSQSYDGQSLDFKDLSTNGRNFKFQSKPTVIGNRIVTNGGNKLIGPPCNSFNFDENYNYSLLWYGKTNALNHSTIIFFTDLIAQYKRGLLVHPAWTDQLMAYDQAGCCGPETRLNFSVQGYWDDMCLYAIVRDEKGRHIYINGQLMATHPDRGLSLTFDQVPAIILGSDSEALWKGELNSFMLYNRGLNISEIKSLYQWVNNGYEFKTFSWNDAVNYCESQGQRLCNYSDYCPRGAMESPVYRIPRGDQWAPVADSMNQWVQLSDPSRLCQLHTNVCKGPNEFCGADGKPLWGTESGKTVHPILCCDIPRIPGYFDTIGQIGPSTCLFFKNDVFMQYDLNTHTSTDVISLSTLKMEGTFAEGQFQACLDYPASNELYLFKGNLVVKYNYVTNLVSTPVALNILYPGLSLAYQRGEFDTCLRLDQTQFVIFKGTQILVYNEITQKAGTPRSINLYWPGLTSIFAMGRLNGIIKTQGKLCLFKENLYAWYQPESQQMQGPFNIIPDWSGLKIPFIREADQCLIYNTMVNYLIKNNSQKKYDEQIKNYNRLIDDNCRFISYGEYMVDLKAKRARLEELKKQINDGQLSYGQKLSELSKINLGINEINQKISDLTVKIDIEKNKPCPTDAKCQNTNQVKQLNNQTCNRRIMINLLRKQGISEAELEKVQPYISYQPGINNFKIETHPDFYKYSKVPQVAPCYGLSRPANDQKNKPTQTNDLIGEIMDVTNSSIEQEKILDQERKAKQLAQQSEQQTLDIFKKAFDQYGRIIIDLNSRNIEMEEWRKKAYDEAKRKGLDLSESQIELLAIGLQLSDNLRKTQKLLFDSGEILHKIMYDPKFRQILNDINNLNMLLKIRKQELEKQHQDLLNAKKYNLVDQIKIIMNNNQSIMTDIQTIQSNIFDKNTQLSTMM